MKQYYNRKMLLYDVISFIVIILLLGWFTSHKGHFDAYFTLTDSLFIVLFIRLTSFWGYKQEQKKKKAQTP